MAQGSYIHTLPQSMFFLIMRRTNTLFNSTTLQTIIMRCPKPIPHAPLVFLVILSIHMSSFELAYCTAENHDSNTILCPEIEKEALLSFKQSSSHPSNELLSSWNNGSSEVNCCEWRGIVCNNFTGHVSELHLWDYGFRSINPSLLNLTQIRYLDLSSNNFDGMTIPSFIGSLQNLEYLNLSNSGFHGTIPKTLGNLSNLHTLSLEDNSNRLDVDSLEWLLGLSHLEHLNMNRVDLSKASRNWALVINSLSSLVELHFSQCSLNFNTDNRMNEVNVSSSLSFLHLSYNDGLPSSVPKWISQLSNLIFLDLGGNHFEGPILSISNTTKLQHIELYQNNFSSTIPNWLYACEDLQFVDLAANFLQGTVSSAIANLSSLNTLDLSNNQLSGNIPREIANLCKMQTLDLSYNKLQGELSDSFGNMSDCFLDSLQYLIVGGNQLSGHIADEFGEFKSLKVLDLSRNLLSGPIPPRLGHLMSLEELRLDNNKLSGNLPESLGQLSNLKYLVISHNKLEGVVTENHFANLTKLKYLVASDIHQLSLKVNPNWNPPFQLVLLRLRSSKLGTMNIPSWLNTQKNLLLLDLSSTGISGVVPNWIWGIRDLNLSHNNFHGKIPNRFGNSSRVVLSSNQFSGPLPRAGDSMSQLDLSNNSFSGGLSHFLCYNMTNLWFLHLGGNKLAGELPDCFMNLPSLQVLHLGNNSLSGNIPNSIGFLTNLISLDLYRNNISGRILISMRNCTNLVKIDIHDNNLDGDIPTWIGTSLTQLAILILRSNKLSGEISSDICLLNSLHILDISDNRISGIIPSCVNNFTAMVTKPDLRSMMLAQFKDSSIDGTTILIVAARVYSDFFIDRATVFTKGHQYQYDTILPLVTNMDLSNNNLSGDIPKGLTSLVKLRSLNLSGNHLTGLIPKNIGDMKQLESLDFSMNSLSGGIPDSFSAMSSLNYLNLSYNKLTGRIPESTQFNTFNASSFVGNQLCGPPLTRNCSSDGDRVPAPGTTEEHEGGESNIDWFYVFVSSGFAIGFSAACSTLVLKKSWRDGYFGFVEDIWDKLYVFCYVKWRMFARRR